MSLKRETVTSTQNKYVSLARGLTNKKNREKERLFRFDGVKLMCEALKNGVKISFALVDENSWAGLLEKSEKLYGISEKNIDFEIVFVTDRVFSAISEEMGPEGIVCVAEYTQRVREIEDVGLLSDVSGNEKIVLLESVRDPLNVGAIVRAAAAFGVDRIIMSRDCADVYNAKTVRASMGNIFGANVDRVADIPFAIRTLQNSGRRVFAAALDKDSYRLGELEIKPGDCVLIGNEGHGLSPEAIETCDGTVYIPMAEGVESLNAATAAAVLAWEFFGGKG